jgi:hypothetical protein
MVQGLEEMREDIHIYIFFIYINTWLHVVIIHDKS